MVEESGQCPLIVLVSHVSGQMKICGIHLERQSRLDLLLKRLGDDAVKLGQDFDSQLRIDTLSTDQIVQRVRQRHAKTASKSQLLAPRSHSACRQLYPRCQARGDRRDVPSMTIEIVEVGRVVCHRVYWYFLDGGGGFCC